ncbi:transposase [Pseudoalteromonas ruthenica]|uniref:transposase n=5 Tax=Pseudoalteromonas ruthenica TaxID=151081 RepID=UPI00110A6315|nr:transposase [Pseudoalteromonas ruthenica]TMO52413.1 transposase [Pseudoalteromonas ruthenica]
MARRPRLNLPHIPQHVVQRGNNRQATFFTEQDFTVYLNKVKDYSRRFDVSVHAFVLMTNHVHLLMTPTTATGVSQLMQSLGRYYVRYVNNTYKRTGTLWEGRFKSSLVDSDRYLLLVSRYIELNPVRANMVVHPSEYPWSSYRHNALDKQIELIKEHPVYQALGKDKSARKQAYQALFKSQMPDYCVAQIRDALQRTWVLGDERFKKQIEQQLGHTIELKTHGGDRKSASFNARDKNQQL